MKNSYSELTVDIQNSIARAYDPNISKQEIAEVKAHLAYILPKLGEPNSLNQPVKDAIAFIHQQESKNQSWKDWLGKPILVATITAVITAPISIFVGISIEKSKLEKCDQATSAGNTEGSKGITSRSSGTSLANAKVAS